MVRLHKEDLQLYANWVRSIIARHCKSPLYLDYIEVSHHERLGKLEADFVIKCENDSGRIVKIIVELKETDLGKVVKQAAERREKADYVYIAVDLKVDEILGWLGSSPGLAKRILENGIGVVSTIDDVIVFKSYHKSRLHYAERRATLVPYLEKTVEAEG